MNRILALWGRLTEPKMNLIDHDDRQKAKLLASLYLLFAPIGLFLAAFPSIVLQNQTVWQDPVFWIMVFIVFLCIAMYKISRTHHYRLTIPMAIILSSGAILVTFALGVELNNTGLAGYYLIIPVFVASIFLTLPLTALVAVFNGIALYFVALFYQPATIGEIVVGPLSFYGSMVIFILLATHYRNKVEEDKRQQIILSQENYQALVEQASDGIFITDEQGKLIAVNNSACEITGYSRQELLRFNACDLSDPDEQEANPLPLEDLYEGKVVLNERLLHRKDGSTVSVELSAKRLKDGRFQGIVRDITWRKETESALIQSEATNRALLLAMPDPIFRIDPNGRILGFIPGIKEVVPYFPNEEQSLGIFAYVPPHMINEVKARLELTTFTGQTQQLEYSVENNGSTHHYDVRIVPVQSKELLYILRDNTEEKITEDLMFRKQKMESLGILAGGVAHDFNNLLVAILGQSSLALRKAPPEEPLTKHIKKVIEAAEHAAKLTRQMLDYSGRGHFQKEILQINDLLQENINLLKVGIPKGITLEANLNSDLPLIEADAGQLEQVVMNLILNAAEAIESGSGKVILETQNLHISSRGPTIRLYSGETLAAGDYVHFSVRDNGRGMDEETMAKIFDPFFTTKFTGRGLGLAAVLGIINGHHGGIQVDSFPNVGTTFHVYLPASRKETTLTPDFPLPTEHFPASVILVIDDEYLVLDAVKDILEVEGVEVLVAENGRDGIDIFAERAADIDLVLLDLSMPGLSTLDIITALRHIKSDATIIISSGYDEGEVTNRLSGATVSGFLQKPYRLDSLLRYLQEFLAK